jgi:predicted amidophosphoribosyltransferase
MHKSKLPKQKQNHAKLIAGHLEHYARTQGIFKKKSLRLQLVDEVLVQIRETKPQKYLNKRERRLNVQNAFALGKDAAKIKDKDVILIDDVLTSGATMYEALKEIRKAQPRSILICTLARTIYINHAKSRRVET